MTRTASIDRPSPVPARPDELAALRAIAEASGDIAFVLDPDGWRLRYLSPSFEQLLGHSADALQAHLTDPELAGPLAVLAVTLRSGPTLDAPSAQACELKIEHLDGSSVTVQLVSTCVAGDPAVLTGTIRDQSAAHALEAEHKRFASMLNHEFRTPLAVIDGAVQRLEATAGRADEATRQRYRKIGAAVDRLIGMLDEYLSPERMAALGKTRAPSGVNLAALLEDAAAQARAAGRSVTLSADGLPSAMRGDQQGLRLVLKMLVDNALAYSPANSAIDLAARRVQNGVELSVRDHGPGIAPADAAHIFDKSYRGLNAAGISGSGLGLYMARSVIEVHGGTLELAKSDADGAMFKIWLPTPVNDGKVVASAEPSSDNQLKQAGETPSRGAAP
jgi:PAS domain S-box-containing protein